MNALLNSSVQSLFNILDLCRDSVSSTYDNEPTVVRIREFKKRYEDGKADDQAVFAAFSELFEDGFAAWCDRMTDSQNLAKQIMDCLTPETADLTVSREIVDAITKLDDILDWIIDMQSAYWCQRPGNLD